MKLLLLVMFLPGLLHAQLNPDSLRLFITEQIKNYRIPALAIGIIKGDSILLEQGFGTLSSTDKTAVTSETLFPIMSCTKAFTSTCFALLADEGKIKWSDKIITNLPELKLSDVVITKTLNITDVLSHRSGLESFEGDLLWYQTNYTPDEIIRRIRYSPIKNEFRKEYGYQNVMYIVAGRVLEKVTKRHYQDIVKQRIFDPLGMHHSYVGYDAIKNEKLALPHLDDHPTTPIDISNAAQAGGIYSTVHDMTRWMKMWLNEGAGMMSKKSFTEMITPKVYLDKDKKTGYGLGWEIAGKYISHGGGLPGYKSLVTIDLEKKTGVVILTNKITYFNEELAQIVMDWANGKQITWNELEKNLSSKNFRFSWEEGSVVVEPHGLDDLKMKGYTGNFADVQYGGVSITLDNDTANIFFLPTNNKISGFLKHINRDTFQIVFRDPFISSGKIIFHRNESGSVDAFRFNIPPGDFIFDHMRFRRKN